MDNRETPPEYKDKFMLSFVEMGWADPTMVDPRYKGWTGGRVEISYHKAFKMVSARVMQMLEEKIDEKNTFEPPKESVNKGKTPAFADVNPIWLGGWDSNPRPID